MSITIITRHGNKTRPSVPCSHENREEFVNEKRARELLKKGYITQAVAGMMQLPEHYVERLKRKVPVGSLKERIDTSWIKTRGDKEEEKRR